MTQIIDPEQLKNKPGSIKLNDEERKEAAELGFASPSEYLRYKLRQASPTPIAESKHTQPKNDFSTDIVTLASENAALKVENRMLREQSEKSQGLSGLDYVNMEMTKFKYEQLEKQNKELQDKLTKLEDKYEQASETLGSIDKTEKYISLAGEVLPVVGEKILNALGKNFPDATERLLDRLAGGSNAAQTVSLTEEDKEFLKIGRSLKNGFKSEHYETALAIIGKLMDSPELIHEVKEYILTKSSSEE